MSHPSGPSRKTVVEIDLVGYSTICAALEGLSVSAVADLNGQFQGFVDAGLAAVGLGREGAVVSRTGDGAILVFEEPDIAHDFLAATHAATRKHNLAQTQPLAKRVFRSGIATGEIALKPKPGGGVEVAGTAIARAVRLEAKAWPGGVLADVATYAVLSPERRALYGPQTTACGRRDEVFEAYPCQLDPNGPEAAAHFEVGGAGIGEGGRAGSSALNVWRRRLAFLEAEEARVSDSIQAFAVRERIAEAREKIRELGG